MIAFIIILACLAIFLFDFLSSLELYIGQKTLNRRIARATGFIKGYRRSLNRNTYPRRSFPIVEFLPQKATYTRVFTARQTKSEVSRWLRRGDGKLTVCYDPNNPKDARLLIPAAFFPSSTMFWFTWCCLGILRVVLPALFCLALVRF